ncbi:MAG: type II secretion system protein [Halanaerobiaceae bacterium]
MDFKGQSGFSLIEVMVSLLLVAIVGTIFSAAFLNGIAGLKYNQVTSDALNEAKNRINEAILNNDYDESSTMTITFNEDGIDELEMEIDGNIIKESVEYSSLNGNPKIIELNYFRAVIP